MFDWGYYLYRFAGEDETVEWLRVKNHDGAITWQWNLSVNNATSFDTISEAKNYAKKNTAKLLMMKCVELLI